MDEQTIREAADYIKGVLENAVIAPLNNVAKALDEGAPESAEWNLGLTISNLKQLVHDIEGKMARR